MTPKQPPQVRTQSQLGRAGRSFPREQGPGCLSMALMWKNKQVPGARPGLPVQAEGGWRGPGGGSSLWLLLLVSAGRLSTRHPGWPQSLSAQLLCSQAGRGCSLGPGPSAEPAGGLVLILFQAWSRPSLTRRSCVL